MTHAELKRSPEFAALCDAAVRLGRDPLQIQGPGGNVSLKSDGVMWVKASGTWLADAGEDEIFAPVDAASLKAALLAGDPRANTPGEFAVGDGLRPSIETSFHAALDAPVVLHTHCVATIARSVTGQLGDIDDLGLVRVPYFMPGARLAKAVVEAWKPGTRGAILGNHGLIATAPTVAEAEALVQDVARRLDPGPAPSADPDPGLDAALSGSGWRALGRGATTALAFDEDRLQQAAGPALFPDQVIFLGPAPIVARSGELFETVLKELDGPPRSLAILPGLGAAVPADASPATVALAEMMGEVIFRIPPGARISRLSEKDVFDLLGWDAEKHRQALEKARTARQAGKGPA